MPKINLETKVSKYFKSIDQPVDCPNFYVSGVNENGCAIISKSYEGIPNNAYDYDKLRKEIFDKRGL